MHFTERSNTAEAAARRRNIRKGTRSCWECKRRKVRCTFASLDDAVCSNCRRRGAVCAGQELPEEVAPPREEQIGDRIARVEDMVQDLAKQVSAVSQSIASGKSSMPGSATTTTTTPSYNSYQAHYQDHGSSHDIRASNSTSTTRIHVPKEPTPSPRRQSSSGLGKNGNITKQLLAAFPSPQDTESLCKMIHHHNFYFHLADSRSFGALEQEGLTPLKLPSSGAELMNPNSHPVLLARTILLLCSFVQACEGSTDQLTEDPQDITKRLIEAVSTLVTNNEELHGTMEFLECVLYESVFYKCLGNLRRAWQLVRKALLVAQLMGIHRPRNSAVKAIESPCQADPNFVWLRILYLDRYLCLILGLPQGTPTPQLEMQPEDVCLTDGPLDRLSRLHVVMASRILERNERSPENHDLDVTLKIDAELIKTGKTMPEEFWMPPEFVGIELGSESEFWETARVSAQVFYYALVIQLHLPCLLLFSPDAKYDYSKTACVNAGREILLRFISYFRARTVLSCHRALSFLALMASITILLGHFDGHLYKKDPSVFAHQRRSDRGMVKCLLMVVERMKDGHGCLMFEGASKTLQCLLDIEEEASNGGHYRISGTFRSGFMNEGENDPLWEGESQDYTAVQLCIPYFGHVRIERDKTLGTEAAPIEAGDEIAHRELMSGRDEMSSLPPDLGTNMEMDQFLTLGSQPLSSETLAVSLPQDFNYESYMAQVPGTDVGETLLTGDDYPDMRLGADYWESLS